MFYNAIISRSNYEICIILTLNALSNSVLENFKMIKRFILSRDISLFLLRNRPYMITVIATGHLSRNEFRRSLLNSGNLYRLQKERKFLEIPKYTNRIFQIFLNLLYNKGSGWDPWLAPMVGPVVGTCGWNPRLERSRV